MSEHVPPAIAKRVEADYKATRKRLRDDNDPEYVRLSEYAAFEEQYNPTRFLARNRLALYVELQMPPA